MKNSMPDKSLKAVSFSIVAKPLCNKTIECLSSTLSFCYADSLDGLKVKKHGEFGVFMHVLCFMCN
jgi:hypothetical protein